MSAGTVRDNNAGALFAIFALIGAISLILLPIAIELAVEVTRNADMSSAVLWFSCVCLSIFHDLFDSLPTYFAGLTCSRSYSSSVCCVLALLTGHVSE